MWKNLGSGRSEATLLRTTELTLTDGLAKSRETLCELSLKREESGKEGARRHFSAEHQNQQNEKNVKPVPFGACYL